MKRCKVRGSRERQLGGYGERHLCEPQLLARLTSAVFQRHPGLEATPVDASSQERLRDIEVGPTVVPTWRKLLGRAVLLDRLRIAPEMKQREGPEVPGS